MNLFRNISWYSPVLSLLIIMVAGPVSCDRPATMVLIRTDMGDLTVELYPEKAPVTANNFLAHVDKETYTNSVFYRVVRMDNQPQSKVKIEVIQGGLFHDDILDTITPIVHETTRETGILHRDGIISMARNKPGSASTEFFICIGDQPSLDYGGDRNPDKQGFAAFGKVVDGMDVVRSIQALPDEGQYLEEQVQIREISRLSER
ncbi:MAG: peptidylprolyl isomerase [Bacteroidota bacterium]|nr:peptidylprolyl isomerase [Bacteroidota bacterium]